MKKIVTAMLAFQKAVVDIILLGSWLFAGKNAHGLVVLFHRKNTHLFSLFPQYFPMF